MSNDHPIPRANPGLAIGISVGLSSGVSKGKLSFAAGPFVHSGAFSAGSTGKSLDTGPHVQSSGTGVKFGAAAPGIRDQFSKLRPMEDWDLRKPPTPIHTRSILSVGDILADFRIARIQGKPASSSNVGDRIRTRQVKRRRSLSRSSRQLRARAIPYRMRSRNLSSSNLMRRTTRDCRMRSRIRCSSRSSTPRWSDRIRSSRIVIIAAVVRPEHPHHMSLPARGRSGRQIQHKP